MSDSVIDDYCWWHPKSPECVDAGNDSMEMMTNYTADQVMRAKATMVAVPLILTVQSVLKMMEAGKRYDTDIWSTTFAQTGTNWWSIGGMILNYGNISMWGVAWLTALLGAVGVAPEAMLMAFGYACGGLIANLVISSIVLGIAQDATWDSCNTSSNCQVNGYMNEIGFSAAALAFGLSLITAQKGAFKQGLWESVQETDAAADETAEENTEDATVEDDAQNMLAF